jgi:hypothetical protein
LVIFGTREKGRNFESRKQKMEIRNSERRGDGLSDSRAPCRASGLLQVAGRQMGARVRLQVKQRQVVGFGFGRVKRAGLVPQNSSKTPTASKEFTGFLPGFGSPKTSKVFSGMIRLP